ncbi:MAG: ADP-ribosylglycohydrolase family protein [Candidatus Aminicenantes bacterium]|nr:ADP-ribosylglycohydrolase family protein [Candidatus Aminicenantes bacterium]
MFQKYKGCLIGLAVGDALGAAVEFLSLNEIHSIYGKKGITSFDRWRSFKTGSYTDDTQLSLATARGLIKALASKEKKEEIKIEEHVYSQYLHWFKSQTIHFHRRSPGHTCLSSLSKGIRGSMKHKINNSKGCGGVMRVAPVGLVFSEEDTFFWGAECASMTHGHPTGYLTAGFLSLLIYYLRKGERMESALSVCLKNLKKYEGHEETLHKIEYVLEPPGFRGDVDKIISNIGEGFLAEEALAIAIFCAQQFPDDFAMAVRASVNHSGDSDSTGCITGALMGTKLGAEAIPRDWLNRLENASGIEAVARRLFDLSLEEKAD